jgi:hypothetical protein
MKSDDDLERELQEIRELLRDYVDDSVERREQQRAENIQILVALGILGAFITLYAQGIVSSSSLSPFFWIIAIASGAFLSVKTLISPLTVGSEDGFLTRLNNKWTLYSYVFMVSMSFLIAIIILIPVPTITVPDETTESNGLVAGSSAVFASLLVAYTLRKRVSQYSAKREETQRRLRQTLSGMKETDLTEILLSRPELLSVLLKEEIKDVISQPKFGKLRPDILAETEDGADIIIELKVGKSQESRGRNQLRDYINKYEETQHSASEVIGCLIILSDEEIKVIKTEGNHVKSTERYQIAELVSEFPSVDFSKIVS